MIQIYSKFLSTLNLFIGYSNLNLSEPEIEELSIMILSTSNELDRILNRIQNEVRENVIKSMQSLVISILKANHSSYFDMMDQVNKKISSIYDFQSTEQNVRSKFVIILNKLIIGIYYKIKLYYKKDTKRSLHIFYKEYYWR